MFKIIAVLCSLSEVIDSVKTQASIMAHIYGRKEANVVHAGYSAFHTEILSKMDRSRHYSEEHRTLIKKLIGEGKTYKEVQKTIGCSAKMISNALKWHPKPERRGKKQSATIRID